MANRAKYTRGEIIRLINRLNRYKEGIEFRSKQLSACSSYYYSYHNESDGITKWLYESVGKTPPKTERYGKNSIRTKIEEKDLKIDFYALQNKLTEKKDKVNKEISKLKTRYLNIKARQYKQKMVASIADRIKERNADDPANFRYCTKTGREVDVSFNMSRKVQRDKSRYYNTEHKDITSFAQAGVAKIQGYMFNSHFRKKTKGEEHYYYGGVRKDKGGLLRAANKAGADQSVIDEALTFSAKMKDSLFVKYIDTGKVGSAKIKDIYILDVDKRANKSLDRILKYADKIKKYDFNVPGVRKRIMVQCFAKKMKGWFEGSNWDKVTSKEEGEKRAQQGIASTIERLTKNWDFSENYRYDHY